MKRKLMSMTYLGFTAMDRRFSNAMLPWLLREIRTIGIRDKISVAIEDGHFKAYNGVFEPVIVHRLVDIIRASQVPGSPEEMFYLLLNEKDSLLNCYLFRAASVYEVTELFGQMRDPGDPAASSPKGSTGSLTNGAVTKNVGFLPHNSAEHLPWNTPGAALAGCNSNLVSDGQGALVRSSSNASALTSLCVDLSPSDSHFFEVLYIGKVRISQRKVPETLIDDALKKFALHEAEKALKRRHSLLPSSGASLFSTGSSDNLTDEKKSNSIESFNKKLASPSTTPLEPDKANPWKSVEALAEKSKDSTQIDDEFDLFTKERAEIIKKPQLEIVSNVNVPKNNLGTVDEDEEKSDIHSAISETASSITVFCQNDSNSNTVKSDNDAIVSSNKFTVDSVGANSDAQRITTVDIGNVKNDSIDPLNKVNTTSKENLDISFKEIQRRSKLDEEIEPKKLPENVQYLRDRSASIGTITTKTPISQLTGEQNRTMLFQVGRSELRLISPDRKQILLHRAFKDVASCVLGRINKEHFGFVCRETNDTYACYVFQCESDCVAGEVINAIRQAFIAHADLLKKSREKSPNMTCEHCPMLWYHRLCHDVEGMTDKRTHAFILRRLEQLPEDEQDLIVTKYQGGTNHMFETSEHNSFLMMLLRAHCEAKQQRHIHDTAENRSEFLNQYLGGSTIFMKAKRSLSSGFDHLLKRKSSRDDGMAIQVKKETSPLPIGVETYPEPQVAEFASTDSGKNHIPPVVPNTDGSPESNLHIEEKGLSEEREENNSVNSPMIDIFLKVSDARTSPTESGVEPDATWRQAIYEKVIKPTEMQPDAEISCLRAKPGDSKRSKEELRQLWKMAINQTVLLVRMERENARLKEREESSAVRRIKLEYTELGACDAGVSLMWDSLLSRGVSQPMGRVDQHMLTQAVIQGVPRVSRGAIWYFLAEQACLRSPPPDTRDFPLFHTPYKSLLGGLTKHQHAILIDLGRTFPRHSYFAAALGPGQLALYNILKAYSLLDPDVGYCQGLSFVAGVLLLHMEEGDAFTLLRHLMFRRGLRRQYLPDMSALQVQLYQLSRLLRDHEPELHAKLEAVEVSPALYAAPWMLTLFTSQFPLGLVVRVFDLIFLDSLDVVFSVALALLSVHKDGLMMCESCEEAAEYLKHKLPDMNRSVYEKVMRKVHSLDISRQLSDYAVEYAVLREEMPRLATLTEVNKTLQAENMKMSEELDSAMDAIMNYQKNQARLETMNKNMEQQLTLLSRYISAHQRDMPVEIKKIVQNHSKRLSFSSKIFSSKNEEETDSRKIFKQGMSTPNLFAKITRDERDQMKQNSPEREKRFVMKKSQSVHSGLISRNMLKVLEERDESRKHEIVKDDVSVERLKDLKMKNITSTQEQIRQEMLFEKQLKHDFDENLKRLDEKLNPKSYIDDLNIFQSRKSMSLNLGNEGKVTKLGDSGYVTPITPELRKDDASSVISHPLSDCDVDIKFDGQSTKLKQIRPLKVLEKN